MAILSSRNLACILALLCLLSILSSWELIEPSFRTTYHSLMSKLGPLRSTPDIATNDLVYSLKVLVYIFPQFHAFADNDKFWGANFTDWTNVRPITKNALGLEYPQPHSSIGYYNMLNYEIRKRQGAFIKENKIYGAVYHHYWFGRPVMDGVLNKLLEDGEPNVPFMLSWANEQWTKTWSGTGKADPGDVLIAQVYGTRADWRVHFDWLLPFFLHPLHIRDHGRVPFIIYNMPDLADHAESMIKAFKEWAVEAGIELQVFQTIWAPHQVSPWVDGLVNFAPHHSGSHDHDTGYYGREKRHIVHNRGTLVCWDNTPRHPLDKKVAIFPYCHPNRFRQHLIKMLEFVKMTPNPPHYDNYFLINALNEWAEGDALEPSQIWYNRYAGAVKSAITHSERQHKWLPERTWRSDRNQSSSTFASICYLVGVSPRDDYDNVNNLQRLLSSLQAQENQNWHAIIFSPSVSTIPDLKSMVEKNADERLTVVEIVAQELSKTYDASSLHKGADWLMQHIIDSGKNAACGTSKYLHITEGHNFYSTTALSWPADRSEDVVALSSDRNSRASKFYSESAIQKNAAPNWNSMCGRLGDLSTSDCPRTLSADNAHRVDLSAFLISMDRWRAANLRFQDLNVTNVWTSLALLISEHQWRLTDRNSTKCDVLQDPSLGQCRRTGGIWLDSPVSEETGCYTPTQLRRLKRVDAGETWQWDLLTEIEGKYDWRYDLQRFRQDPTCIRFTEKVYNRRVKSLA